MRYLIISDIHSNMTALETVLAAANAKWQEAVCLGATILAGVATGIYTSFAEAIGALVREESVVEPDSALAADYVAQMRQYRSLYPALAPVRDVPAHFAKGGEPQ